MTTPRNNEPLSKETVYPGLQVAYIPTHANGDINHPDVEFGFVTSANKRFAFCRFWARGPRGKPSAGALRTTANSEAVAFADLRRCDYTHEYQVNNAMARIVSSLDAVQGGALTARADQEYWESIQDDAAERGGPDAVDDFWDNPFPP